MGRCRMSTIIRGQDQFRLGLMFAVGSAFTFRHVRSFAKSLMVAGLVPDGRGHRGRAAPW